MYFTFMLGLFFTLSAYANPKQYPSLPSNGVARGGVPYRNSSPTDPKASETGEFCIGLYCHDGPLSDMPLTSRTNQDSREQSEQQEAKSEDGK